jgi:RNA polymerase sigma factor (sigma-70 family)
MAADLKGQAAPLHPEDLALAQACARGDTDAWDRFVVEYRPILYRAADAIDRTGTARELADALYAELFGLKEQDGERQSLFRYFHGRSSLATWLRAVLSQRYVDRIRATRRLEELPDEETHLRQGSGGQANPMSARAAATDPDASRFGAAMQDALRATIAALEPRDRLRLGCYYAQEMTLVQIGKLTRESEATVSRQLARTRRGIKDEVERRLRDRHRFGDREVAECLASVVEDAGELDLAAMLGPRKKPAVDRSKVGGLR